MEAVARLSNIYVIKALSITRCAYTICFSPSEIDIRGRSASILDSTSDGTGTGLRTGIYIGNVHEDSVFPVIFWPEDTTWHDDAEEPVRKNRMTFMR